MALGTMIAAAVMAMLVGTSVSIRQADAVVALKGKKGPTSVSVKTSGASSLKIKATLPFEKVSAIINQFDIRLDAKGVKKDTFIGDVSYAGTGRVGTVVVRASGSDKYPIEFKAPFRWKGQIKGFDVVASGNVTINFGIHAGNDWCKVIEFDEPKVALVESKTIDLSRVPFASQGVVAAIEGALGDVCKQLKDALAGIWHNAVLPLEIRGKTLFINIDPKAISITSATVQGTAIQIGLSLAFESTVTTKRPPSNKPKLPPPDGAVAINSGNEIEATLLLNLGLVFD
jgi:hypothetical protein